MPDRRCKGPTSRGTSVEQLPVIAPDDYDRRFGDTTARELVRDHVLRLTYTAHDMEPFARDLGYDGPPFVMGRGGAPPPAGEARRPLLPPLRPRPGGRGLRAGHLPDSPAARRGPIRLLPHPRPGPRLHERPGRRRHRDGGVGVGERTRQHEIRAALLHYQRNRGGAHRDRARPRVPRGCEPLCPGVQRRTLQRDLRVMMEKGLLLRQGSTNRIEYILVEGVA